MKWSYNNERERDRLKAGQGPQGYYFSTKRLRYSIPSFTGLEPQWVLLPYPRVIHKANFIIYNGQYHISSTNILTKNSNILVISSRSLLGENQRTRLLRSIWIWAQEATRVFISSYPSNSSQSLLVKRFPSNIPLFKPCSSFLSYLITHSYPVPAMFQAL